MKNLAKYTIDCNQIYKLNYRYFIFNNNLLVIKYATHNDRVLVSILLGSNKKLTKEIEELDL